MCNLIFYLVQDLVVISADFGNYAPQRLIIGKPISQYALYSAMFCPLYSNINKEQHEKHLCNPSSHYGKYGEYTRETRALYLDT